MQRTTNRYNTITRKGVSSQFRFLFISWMLLSVFISVGFTDELGLVPEVEFQPLASATERLIEALDYLGSPLSENDLSAIKEALVSENHEQAIADIQRILDSYCLAGSQYQP